MKLVEINWRPTDRQLRQFGFMALFALPIIAWIFTKDPGLSAWRTGSNLWIGIAAGLGAAAAAVAMLRPRALTPVFLLLSLIALPIGLVVSELILLMIYFGVFTPVALLFKLIGRDALERRFDRQAASYWTEKSSARSVENYFRQS